MHEHLWHHPGEKETEQAQSEPEICPIMSIFHDLQRIALEVHSSIEVLFVEGLHWDLAFAMVFGSVFFAVKLEIVFHGTSRKAGLLILSRRYRRSYVPKSGEYGYTGEDCKKDPGEKSSIDLTSKVAWNQRKKGTKEQVGKVVAARRISRQRRIFD